MRERLTLAFVGLTVSMLLVAGVIRGFALGDAVRSVELTHLGNTADSVAQVVDARLRADEPVTSADLEGYALPETKVTVRVPDQDPIVVEGVGFSVGETGGGPGVDQSVGDASVHIEQSPEVVSTVVARERSAMLALLLVLTVLTALLGFVLSTVLARPFSRLAESAGALGRGRFEIETPDSRIPEVISIAGSLQASASQLRDSISRDREFFHHTSHVLRTPLTGMRLELEELSMRGDLDDETRRTLTRCLREIQGLDTTVAELLDFARAKTLVSGAEVSLLTLGAHVAQRWRDEVSDARDVRAYVDGGPDVMLTPGPVEQLLDHVLRDVVDWGTGTVTLRFTGEEQHVKVAISCGPLRDGAGERASATAARAITEVLGGRYDGDAATDGGLDILLPRR